MNSDTYHTIIVGFAVKGEDREKAQRTLMGYMPQPWLMQNDPIDCWWIAEDDRIDGSDNDSAIFVPMGKQSVASEVLVSIDQAQKIFGDTCVEPRSVVY